MREILFRGKRLDNGELVEGYYLHLGPVAQERAYIVPYYASALYTYEVDPATVGQFTGLLDKNGKRIFEGDIIKFASGLMWVVGFKLNAFVALDKDNQVQFSLFEQYKWKPNITDPYALEPVPPKHIEIIGNIHDNPELLEVTTDE